MTDDEFQSILDGVNRVEVDTDGMAEGLDLASQSVGGGEATGVAIEPEGVVYQSVEEVEEKQAEEERPKSETPQSEARESENETEEKEVTVQLKEAEVQPEALENIVPTLSKSKAVKRKLVLKNDPKAERQKPKRVSQRCLGKWVSSKAGANTAADAVEISSEDERTTPTKPGKSPRQLARRTPHQQQKWYHRCQMTRRKRLTRWLRVWTSHQGQ